VIRPCGEPPEVMTSMAALLGREVGVDEVGVCVRAAMAAAFQMVEIGPVAA
jgi:lipoate-protein ligase B